MVVDIQIPTGLENLKEKNVILFSQYLFYVSWKYLIACFNKTTGFQTAAPLKNDVSKMLKRNLKIVAYTII